MSSELEANVARPRKAPLPITIRYVKAFYTEGCSTFEPYKLLMAKPTLYGFVVLFVRLWNWYLFDHCSTPVGEEV